MPSWAWNGDFAAFDGGGARGGGEVEKGTGKQQPHKSKQNKHHGRCCGRERIAGSGAPEDINRQRIAFDLIAVKAYIFKQSVNDGLRFEIKRHNMRP